MAHRPDKHSQKRPMGEKQKKGNVPISKQIITYFLALVKLFFYKCNFAFLKAKTAKYSSAFNIPFS